MDIFAPPAFAFYILIEGVYLDLFAFLSHGERCDAD